MISVVVPWDGAKTLDVAIQELPELGIHHLTLRLGTSEVQDVSTLKTQLSRYGLRIISCDISSGSPLDVKVLEAMKEKIQMACQLGASIAICESGFANNDKEFDRIIDHLHELADCADTFNLKLALDTQPGLTQNWRAMAHTIQSLSHDRVKLNFDPGNLVFLNEQVQVDTSLARVCQHVAHVYLRDCCSFGTRCYGALGTGGAVDFSCVREILQSTGYTGPYSIVFDDPPSERMELLQWRDRLQRSLKVLEWCGFLDTNSSDL
ncbi:MAG: TIM barrel protein [Planctomycetota bacterium]|nr:TIM barrel protein [Planctomycetota bacterium]